MTELAFYVNAIKKNNDVVCIQEETERDNLAETQSMTLLWRHASGVIIRYRREIEVIADTESVCPECWISWEIIDACGQHIRPVKKSFHNACQEIFWLKMNQ